MELRQMRYFVAAARLQHFTRAAAEVGVAQPAFSQQIRALERELGVSLFERTTRQVRLTEAGAAFLARAERLLADLEDAQAEVRAYAGLARGRVALGTLQSIAVLRLPALLARFHALYPGIEIVLREENTEQLLAMLRGGALDLALIQHGAQVVPREELPPGIAAEPILTEDVVLAVSQSHALAGCDHVALRAVADEPFVLFKPGSGLRQTLLRAAAAAGFEPHVAFESGDIMTVRTLAAEGLGVTVLPQSIAAAGPPPVAAVAIEPPLGRTVSLAWREDRYRPPAAAAFLAFAREDLRRHAS